MPQRHLGLILLLVLCVTAAAGQKNASGLRVVGNNATRGVPKQAGYCRAFAPQDWVMRSRPQGDTADLDGAGGQAHASWGMLPINTALRAYAGDLNGPPEVSTLALASAVAHAPAHWTSAPKGHWRVLYRSQLRGRFSNRHRTLSCLSRTRPGPVHSRQPSRVGG